MVFDMHTHKYSFAHLSGLFKTTWNVPFCDIVNTSSPK